MEEFDAVENWLSTVANSHSNSRRTSNMYRVALQKFVDFVGKSPNEILSKYENVDDKRFRRKYAQYVRALISVLRERGYSPSTVSTTVNVIRSFFRYNDLPLGFVPSGNSLVEFHNRDMTREEILEVLKLANVRDKAFFAVMAQRGYALQQLLISK